MSVQRGRVYVSCVTCHTCPKKESLQDRSKTFNAHYLQNYTTNILAIAGLISSIYKLSNGIFTSGKKWFLVIHISV